MPTDETLNGLAVRLGNLLKAGGGVLVTAESCTGGWISKVVTDIAGSSAWFDRGFVTYSNGAKQAQLAVPAELLEMHGAVSAEVAAAMARGALAASDASLALSVTGVAGPDGGTAEKPVGFVWFGWADVRGVATESRQFAGDRDAGRRASVAHALEGALRRLG
ncbi:MAG: nicotinamide-nucleotide amidohydrolase family protein [Ectothiorhodospiraceae bacterium]|nr:nicotinamide-nucleotide amidohydrolase family protein [Ectothiorhodospiraceae bacterium]